MSSNTLTIDIDTHGLISNLQKLIKIPSVSARKQNLEECAKEIVAMMKRIGIDGELIYLEDYKNNSVPPSPSIWRGKIQIKSKWQDLIIL